MSCFLSLKIFIFTFSFVAYIITTPLFITWLFLCALIAFIGFLVPKKHISINIETVKSKDTICKILNKKGLLSDEEYKFETNEVAPRYDQLTFCGYLFILNPIIYLLKHTCFIDKFVLYLVHKWMEVHSFKNLQKKQNRSFFSSLVKISVSIANAVGGVLHRN